MAPLKPFTLFAGAMAIGLLLFATVNRRDWLLYNGSASIPTGLYVRVNTAPKTGSFVTVRAADVAPSYATLRGFTDPGDRFIKRVAASGGAEVCADDSHVTVSTRPFTRKRWDGTDACCRHGEAVVSCMMANSS